jgi:hypothetical protein
VVVLQFPQHIMQAGAERRVCCLLRQSTNDFDVGNC